jgi:hypothetical protein
MRSHSVTRLPQGESAAAVEQSTLLKRGGPRGGEGVRAGPAACRSRSLSLPPREPPRWPGACPRTLAHSHHHSLGGGREALVVARGRKSVPLQCDSARLTIP